MARPKITSKDIIYCFSLPPEEAIEYFKKLGLSPSDNWIDTYNAVMNDAFAIAGQKNMDIIQACSDFIAGAIESGISLDKCKKGLEKIVTLRDWHRDLVIQQNISNSYNAGRYTKQQELADTVPYLVPKLGNRLNHTDGCLWLIGNKMCIRADDPDIKLIYSPRHFRCSLYWLSITEFRRKSLGLKIVKVKDIPKAYLNEKHFQRTPSSGSYTPDPSKYNEKLYEYFKKSK